MSRFMEGIVAPLDDLENFANAERQYKASLVLKCTGWGSHSNKHHQRKEVLNLQKLNNPDGIHKVSNKTGMSRPGNKSSAGSKRDGTGTNSSLARPCAVEVLVRGSSCLWRTGRINGTGRVQRFCMHKQCRKEYKLQGEALYPTWQARMSQEAFLSDAESKIAMQRKAESALAMLMANHQDVVRQAGSQDRADQATCCTLH